MSRYYYKLYNARASRGDELPIEKIFDDEHPGYDKKRAIYGLEANKPDDRKKYDVLIYLVVDNVATLKGSATIVNKRLVSYDLDDK